MPLTKSQISKEAKTTQAFNGDPHTSHFPIFPFTCKARSEFMESSSTPTPPPATYTLPSAGRECVQQTPQIKRQSFKLLQVKLRVHTHRPNQTATHPAKLIAWNQTQTNWGTWGTHANRSRLSSLSCDPLQPAITLQIRSYRGGIVMCQHTPSPSIPPVPSRPSSPLQ